MSTTREIRPIDMQMVTEYLRDNLRIEVSTESNYTGGMDGSGSLYSNSHTIRITLAGEEISTAYLG